MPNLHRPLVGGLAAALALAAASVPAIAGGPGSVTKFNSRVTISDKAPEFHGHVRSSGGSLCSVHRKVRLYKQRPGPDKLLGKDKTNRHRRWRVTVTPLTSGGYYARVRRTATVTVGGTFVCRGDRSKTVVVD